MRQVRISKVMNGFIVEVGCQTLVFQRRDELVQELGRYIDDPNGVERWYREKYAPDMPLDVEGVEPCEERSTRGMDMLRPSRTASALERWEERKV